jgi:hypothetical protein
MARAVLKAKEQRRRPAVRVSRQASEAAPSARMPVTGRPPTTGGAAGARTTISMQRAVGNSAVNRMLAGAVAPGEATVTGPDDPREREAQETGRAVAMGRGMPEAETQRAPHGAPGGRTPGVDIEELSGGGQPLPARERRYYESQFGRDFRDVRVHTDVQAAGDLNARAFTTGSEIAFAPGAYAPDRDSGRELIGHELAHVVQQREAAGTDRPVQRQEIAEEDLGGETIEGFTEEEIAEADAEIEAGIEGAEAEGAEGEAEGAEDEAEGAEGEAEGERGELTEEPTGLVRRPGRISRDPAQFLRKQPHPAKGTNIETTLPFNESLFVEQVGGDKNAWYRVTTAAGYQGWVPSDGVALDPPEPNAMVYRVKPGDTAIDLAARWYKPAGGFERWWVPGSSGEGDARFYVSALAYANKGRAGMPSPPDLTKRDAWKQVQVIAPHAIWRPSKEFLRSLEGIVSSGSISREAWETVKRVAKAVWDFLVYAAAFIAGVVVGALESLKDLFMGLIELAEMLWDILKSIFKGTLREDARALWEDIKSIDLSAIGDWFLDQWNAEDPWDQGFFRGRVIGYVAMEIVIAVVTFGSGTAVKLAWKFPKVVALLRKLARVKRVADKVAKAAKIPPPVRSALKKALGGKAGPGGGVQTSPGFGKKVKQLVKLGKAARKAKVLTGVRKARKTAAAVLKTANHAKRRAAAFKLYTGKKSRAAFNKLYDRLTVNRLVGTLSEQTFQKTFKGKPKTYEVVIRKKKYLRKVDNQLGDVAREIKSGRLKLTRFIKFQIKKDAQLLKTVPNLKVEWHLLAGADPDALAALAKAGIKVVKY